MSIEDREGTQSVDVVVGAGSGMGAAVASRLAGGSRLIVAPRWRRSRTRGTCPRRTGRVSRVRHHRRHRGSRLASKVDRLGRLVVTAGLSPTMVDARGSWRSTSSAWHDCLLRSTPASPKGPPRPSSVDGGTHRLRIAGRGARRARRPARTRSRRSPPGGRLRAVRPRPRLHALEARCGSPRSPHRGRVVETRHRGSCRSPPASSTHPWATRSSNSNR